MDPIYSTALLEGLLLGLGLAFLIGPAFFALLDASLHYGFGVSVAIALGVVSSDVLILSISYISLNQLMQIPHFEEIMSFCGSLVLVGSGAMMIVKRNEIRDSGGWHISQFGQLFLKGFSINTLNPFPWMFWFSTSAMVHSQFGHQGQSAPIIFFSAAAGMVLLTDMAKAWAARFLIPYLKPQILIWFRIISGLCLMGFGFQLLYFGIKNW